MYKLTLYVTDGGNVTFKFQLPSLSESELLSELDPELEPELLLEELPLVVLLSESLDAFGSVEFGSKKKNIEHIKLFEVVCIYHAEKLSI